MGDYRRIKDMLCDEMDKIASKGSMNGGDLEVLYKASDILKDLETVEAMQGHSGDYSMDNGSYAPRRDSMGRFTSGRSYGYSRDDGRVVDELHRMMNDTSDERVKMAIKDAIREIEK